MSHVLYHLEFLVCTILQANVLWKFWGGLEKCKIYCPPRSLKWQNAIIYVKYACMHALELFLRNVTTWRLRLFGRQNLPFSALWLHPWFLVSLVFNYRAFNSQASTLNFSTTDFSAMICSPILSTRCKTFKSSWLKTEECMVENYVGWKVLGWNILQLC